MTLNLLRSCIIYALLISTQCLAETVFIDGSSGHGLGWLFLDLDDNCRIATPRHVIARPDGTLGTPDMVERTGRRTPTRDPLAVANPDLDLAFLSAAPTVADGGCTTSRLPRRSLAGILAARSTGVLSISTHLDQQLIDVQFLSASRDRLRGAVVALSPSREGDKLKKGMSGGVVLVNGEPIAMLYALDEEEGIGLALRFDAIAEALAGAPKTSSATLTSGIIRDLALIYGSVAEGELGKLLAGEGSASLVAEAQRVVLLVTLSQQKVVSGLVLEAEEGRGLEAADLIIEAGSATGNFSYITSCTTSAEASRLQCAFAPRVASRFRLTLIKAENAPPSVLASLEMQVQR